MQRAISKTSQYRHELTIRRRQRKYKEDLLSKYLDRKLRKKYKNKGGYWNRDRRPKKLVYLHMAKACKMTYDQIRYRIDELVKNGTIEKFRAWDAFNHKVNYYRFTDW